MKTKYFAVFLGVSALALCSPAYAQDASGKGENAGLEEIVVTAQKRSENLQDVPISVTALSPSVLANSAIQGTISLPKLTPNLSIDTFSMYVSPYLRGVGTAFANPGLEQSVATYFDDQYMPRSTSGFFSFNDIERIEVLKGPQGTLYGRNATGGAIRIISRDPTHKLEGNITAGLGNFDRYVVDATINLPITDNLALRITGRHDERSGFIRNLLPGGPDLGSRNENFIRAKLLWEPTDRLKIKLSADYLHKRDREGQGFLALYNSGPEQIGIALGGQGGGFWETSTNIANTKATKNFLKAGGAALRIDYELDGLTLSSITGYRYNREYSFGDLDGTSADFQQATNPSVLTEVYTQELQAVSDKSGPLEYTAGVFYLHERARTNIFIFGSAIGPGVGIGGIGGADVDSVAPYAQVTYKFSSKFDILVGARYTIERKILPFSYGYFAPRSDIGSPVEPFAIATTPCPAPGAPICSNGKRDLNFKKFTPRVTLTYRPMDDVMLYATYSKGFKSGGFNLPTFASVDEVRPETLDAWEIGAKTEFGRARFNLSAFKYKDKDIQVQITDQDSGAQRTRNAASANIWGIEADFLMAVSEQFSFGMGGGYLDAKYDDYIGDGYVPCSALPASAGCVAQGGLGLTLVSAQNFGGNRMPNAPRFSGYIRADFTQPLPDGSKLIFSPLANYQSKLYWDDANLYSEKARTLLNATLTWKSADDRIKVAVFGDNLTNEQYLVHVAPQVAGGWRTPAAPRTYGVNVGYTF